ncbi:diaminopimelate decarboxylase [Streptoalloteichus tenebrarius]|uniref:Diaminopimelate decarboxylase n=1 Tax=Streptoalloteichus tenebrarius (strain ATCC 17920 / DSM 40477 / JCM 4838 / CBS 697.72 / NBRC 16177 / NCIMB 11028 / NRRL B-12390 / A12253. 1 / ISP 5477) TaxID=1933 RepID=A0ABT1HRJ3_STRSD|nr:type III PLP-dependent enzyme [Streptoalloteichus tenebrarius]MCP2258144.1 diaminopimelate decarboxylase [Streptoalloteichus tenebrarius]BFF04629.1 type III PLP-dependent enzyme [Streptoalloteichus tenebrarius]
MSDEDLIASLVHDYGSPLYVYRLSALARAHSTLRAALPEPCVLYYSVKANPHPVLVAELAARGCRAEISSPGELDVVLAAGVPPTECLYTGPGKTDGEITDALRRGVRCFSVESAGELSRLDAAARAEGVEVDCLLRINAGHAAAAGLRMTGRPSQFGIDVDQLREDPALCRFGGAARVVGLHQFPVSNTTDPQALLDAFGAGAAVAAELRDRHGVTVTELDLGGGFAAPYATDGEPPEYGETLREGLAAVLDRHLPGWRTGEPLVAVESGRRLVGPAGELVCSVTDVKRSGDRTFVVLDTGIHHVGGLSGIGRLLPSSVGAEVLGAGDRPRVRVDLVGPLCTPADVLARAVELPLPRPGDLLRVPNAGAYGLTASVMGFLSRTPPVEVVLDGDEVRSATALRTRRADVSEGGAR